MVSYSILATIIYRVTINIDINDRGYMSLYNVKGLFFFSFRPSINIWTTITDRYLVWA